MKKSILFALMVVGLTVGFTMSQKHIKTMNLEESRIIKNLSEVETNAKLKQAEELLQEILETSPKSRAAKKARRMLGIQGVYEDTLN